MGIRVREGSFNLVTNNHVHYNGLDGIWVHGVSSQSGLSTIARNVASDNGGAGITVEDLLDSTIVGNTGKRNVGNGLEVINPPTEEQSHCIADNEFNRNGGHGICADPDNIDGGGNIGKNNGVPPDVTFNGC
jgi:parallel beta-helix repeat protein